MKKGFTLIELLVVVLIIGILSAIALPQYTKSVEKARLAQVIPLARHIKDAQEVYYMANNKYADTAEELGVEFACPKDFDCLISASFMQPGQRRDMVSFKRKKGNYGIVYSYAYRGDRLPGKIYCWADNAETEGVKLCKSFGGTNGSDSGTTRIIIE